MSDPMTADRLAALERLADAIKSPDHRLAENQLELATEVRRLTEEHERVVADWHRDTHERDERIAELITERDRARSIAVALKQQLTAVDRALFHGGNDESYRTSEARRILLGRSVGS